MGAWLSISNHCVLGSLMTVPAESPTAATHCHNDSPAPSSPESDDKSAPCCKVLKATVATKVQAQANLLDFVLAEYPNGELIASIWQAHTHTLGLDTGPPPAHGFAESVLQRSLLAHAPPSLS